MSARSDLVHRLAALVGSDALRIEDAQSGWPALAKLDTDDGEVSLALFVGQVGRSHRNRDAVERRFQNPAGSRPLIDLPGRSSILLGVWESDPLLPVARPVVVIADAARRQHHQTRWSVFVQVPTLLEAHELGWSSYRSDSDELIRALIAPLLPVAISADLAGVDPSGVLVQTAVDASGVLGQGDIGPDAVAGERARRAGFALVRDARFSRRVLDAYGGRCAMCGLGLGLVQGAHIYPVSAPGSVDEPWNGLALCVNHHLAFDLHMVAVRPHTLDIVFRADVMAAAVDDDAARKFVFRDTLRKLMPASAGMSPKLDMFAKRYAYYEAEYGWFA